MGEGIIDGGDTRIVFNQIAGVEAVGAVGHRRRVEVELLLQRGHQRLHDILTKAFALQNNVAYFRDDDGVEHQRANTRLLIDGVDLLLHRRARLMFSTNGRVTLLMATGNCDITACPSTSAVMAVPSEI